VVAQGSNHGTHSIGIKTLIVYARCMIKQALIGFVVLVAVSPGARAQEQDNIGHARHLHRHNEPHERAADDGVRFTTNRESPVVLPLPNEEDSFFFVVYGDRTGGPVEGVSVLADAVRDTNLLEPDFVMTVGDLVNGYNQTPKWIEQMHEFKGIMDELLCPWFPVAGNHDVYWRGPGKPEGEHEQNYEMHFGPLWYGFTHKNSGFIVLYTDEGDPATGEKNFSKPSANKMSPEQLAWLKETLGKFSGLDHVFVFLHHPRWIGGNYTNTWEPVHEALVDAGNVTAVFAGHIHRMRYDAKDGIEYVTLATVGGGQSGKVPEAGYLHQYHIVTVRKGQIALSSVPVGEIMDVREITGKVSQETGWLADARPGVSGVVTVSPEGGAGGEIRVTIKNPTTRPIEVETWIESDDNWWAYLPDHGHRLIEPGEKAEAVFRVDRLGGALNDRFRVPEVVVATDYLMEGHRYSIPESRTRVPIEAELLAPTVPDVEHVLEVDGRNGVAMVESDRVSLADGPMTLECWFRADSFGRRTGLVAKTEMSEYGFFVSNGQPSFSIHLGGRYIEPSGAEGMLEPGRWYHIAGVYDGEQVRLYLDGKLVEAIDGSGHRTPNPLPLMVGADVNGNGDPTSYFDGRIDGVRVSSVARYAGESFVPERRVSADGDTVLLLNMDARVAAWAYDESASGAHALMVGGAEVVED
jgi:concanavalin A-like lectin/glucanase superfamily protein/calcineurin-like phosphoesterase family protein